MHGFNFIFYVFQTLTSSSAWGTATKRGQRTSSARRSSCPETTCQTQCLRGSGKQVCSWQCYGASPVLCIPFSIWPAPVPAQGIFVVVGLFTYYFLPNRSSSGSLVHIIIGSAWFGFKKFGALPAINNCDGCRQSRIITAWKFSLVPVPLGNTYFIDKHVPGTGTG